MQAKNRQETWTLAHLTKNSEQVQDTGSDFLSGYFFLRQALPLEWAQTAPGTQPPSLTTSGKRDPLNNSNQSPRTEPHWTHRACVL